MQMLGDLNGLLDQILGRSPPPLIQGSSTR
jgi:hypothetical protein